jgi:hypothetical protein
LKKAEGRRKTSNVQHSTLNISNEEEYGRGATVEGRFEDDDEEENPRPISVKA